MPRSLPLLALLGLSAPALAQDDPWGQADTPQAHDPWGLGTPAPGAPGQGPPPPPTVLPMAPLPIPVLPAPPGIGFETRRACLDAARADRGPVARLAPTWRHPSTVRCTYAEGAGRWSPQERPASMVVDATLDTALLAGTGLVFWRAMETDVLENARDNWDLGSASTQSAASVDGGASGQRRDPLPARTEPDQGARAVSNALMYGSLAGAAAAPLALPERNGRLTNSLVMGEILALQFSVQRLVSGSVAEARPLAFQAMQTWTDDDFADAADKLTEPDAFRSYYSGHSSTVASVAYGYATIHSLSALDAHRPEAAVTLMLFPAAFMLANLEGQLRVDALRHDPTDVWVGHLAGALIGSGVPLLHHAVARHGRCVQDASRTAPCLGGAGSAKALSLRPVVGPGNLGLQGSW